MSIAKRVGTTIRDRRHSWPGGKMTLQELSERTGITVSTLSSYEHGRCVPSLEAIIRLSAVLDINLNRLAAEASSAYAA